MNRALILLQIIIGTCAGVTLAVTVASADEPTLAPVTTIISLVITYDSEADLLVAPIDEHMIVASRPDSQMFWSP